MFEWLTGARLVEDAEDPDASTVVDQPETPAHIFAVRAIRHAVVGTPKPKEQFTARQAAAQLVEGSAEIQAIGEMSPTKPNGILMTPGTATAKRNKSVTFGAQVIDNNGKRASKSVPPRTLPGKFPSPWTPKVDAQGEDKAETPASRTKLTEALYKARDTSAKARPGQVVKAKDDMDITLDVMEPRSESGRYWKQEFEAYAEQSKREMKKLITKQRVAKSFAKQKDAQVLELADKLGQEQRKVAKLEAKVIELTAQMQQYRNEIAQPLSHAERDKTEMDTTARSSRAAQVAQSWSSTRKADMSKEKREETVALKPQSPLKRRPQLDSGDIWADAFQSSPLVMEAFDRPLDRLDSASKGRHAELGSVHSPLVARDMNTLHARHTSSGPQGSPERDRRAAPATTPQSATRGTPRRPTSSTRRRETIVEDSINGPLDLPEPSLEWIDQSPAASKSARKSQRQANAPQKAAPDLSVHMQSSPPKFDRLALPFSIASSPAKDRQRSPLRELSVKSAGNKDRAELPGSTNELRIHEKENKIHTHHLDAEGVTSEKKLRIDTERLAKAQARVEAKRQERERLRALVV